MRFIQTKVTVAKNDIKQKILLCWTRDAKFIVQLIARQIELIINWLPAAKWDRTITFIAHELSEKATKMWNLKGFAGEVYETTN